MRVRSSYPEVEEMKSLYNKVFKNNQITYGGPYQIKIPENLLKYTQEEDDELQSGDELSCSVDPDAMLEDAKHKCDMLIKEAQLEADRLIEEAQAESKRQADAIAEEAWQRGYAEGNEAAAEQNRAILDEAEHIRNKAIEEYEALMNNMEADMVALVLDVSRKAVAGELAINQSVIIQLVRDALPNCSNKNGAVLKVCPEDAEYLTENLSELQAEVEGADELTIKPDCTLKPGDCIIETPLGSVDAGTSTKLDKIEAAFREELEGR